MTSITPYVTLVCSGTSITTMTVTMALTSVELTAALGQLNVVLTPPLILVDTMKGDVGLATVVQQQPQSMMPSQVYGNYSMGPPKVSFF